MKRLLSLFTAVILLGIVTSFVFAGQNHNNVEGHECEQGEHVNNPHCNPSPSVSVTPSPELTIVLTTTPTTLQPTQTPTDTPEPTLPVCGDGEHLNLQGDKCLRFQLGGAPSSDEQGTPFKMQGEDTIHGPQK